jgi:hypothetical protein
MRAPSSRCSDFRTESIRFHYITQIRGINNQFFPPLADAPPLASPTAAPGGQRRPTDCQHSALPTGKNTRPVGQAGRARREETHEAIFPLYMMLVQSIFPALLNADTIRPAAAAPPAVSLPRLPRALHHLDFLIR